MDSRADTKLLNWRVINGRCEEVLKGMETNSVDMAFADPPFNIGLFYKGYNDKITKKAYWDWSCEWVKETKRVLKPGASFWIHIHTGGVVALREAGLIANMKLERWIVWTYEFGQYTEQTFGEGFSHLLWFRKQGDERTWNPDSIRVPSKRQVLYKDKRANPKGRVPSNVWEFPKVCGTFKEKKGWHITQMPLALVKRAILATSNPGDVVLDPFLGTGTTLLAARECLRSGIGIESSPDYCAEVEKLLRELPEPEPLKTPSMESRLAKMKIGEAKRALNKPGDVNERARAYSRAQSELGWGLKLLKVDVPESEIASWTLDQQKEVRSWLQQELRPKGKTHTLYPPKHVDRPRFLPKLKIKPNPEFELDPIGENP